MAAIRAITLDLDNTLWDVIPVIERAERNTQRYMDQNFPKIAKRYTFDDVRRLREQIYRACPEIRHDLTELRRQVFLHLLDECGYDSCHASELLGRFLADRNRVELFPDVLPALKQLSATVPLVSLSDGNACLDTIGIQQYFVGSVTAADVGAMKPDPRGFHQACSIAGEPPFDILHVGDHPLYDMYGARNAGMQTMWMARTDEAEKSWDQDFEPDYRAKSLTDLVNLVC